MKILKVILLINVLQISINVPNFVEGEPQSSGNFCLATNKLNLMTFLINNSTGMYVQQHCIDMFVKNFMQRLEAIYPPNTEQGVMTPTPKSADCHLMQMIKMNQSEMIYQDTLIQQPLLIFFDCTAPHISTVGIDQLVIPQGCKNTSALNLQQILKDVLAIPKWTFQYNMSGDLYDIQSQCLDRTITDIRSNCPLLNQQSTIFSIFTFLPIAIDKFSCSAMVYLIPLTLRLADLSSTYNWIECQDYHSYPKKDCKNETPAWILVYTRTMESSIICNIQGNHFSTTQFPSLEPYGTAVSATTPDFKSSQFQNSLVTDKYSIDMSRSKDNGLFNTKHLLTETSLEPDLPVGQPLSTEQSITTQNSKQQTTGPTAPPGGKDCVRTCCVAVDVFNTPWCGQVGETVSTPCGINQTGHATWKCAASGFIGDPDFSLCRSKWLLDMKATLNESVSLHPMLSDAFLSRIERRCTLAEKGRGQGPPPYYSHEVREIFSVSRKLVTRIDETTDFREFDHLSYKGIAIMSGIFVHREPWDVMDEKRCAETGTSFLISIERAAFEVTRRVVENGYHSKAQFSKNYQRRSLNVSYVARPIDVTSNHNTICFPLLCEHSSTYIRLPDDWPKYLPNETEVQFVGVEINSNSTNKIFSSNLLKKIPGQQTLLKGTKSKLINGKLISLVVQAISSIPQEQNPFAKFRGKQRLVGIRDTLSMSESLSEGVTIRFYHDVMAWGKGINKIRRRLHSVERAKAVLGSATCVYWDINSLAWSTEGCAVELATCHYTICKCSHLSSFAILMDVHEYVGQNYFLQILTWILIPISLLCLAICIWIMSLKSVRSGRSPRNEITVHLCVNLFLGNLLMILFVDKNLIYLHPSLCAVTGAATHFFFLAAFCWMTMEAFQLYRMVIVVFDNGQDYKLTQRIVAYGVPALIVFFTVLVGTLNSHYVYGGDEYCWLQDEYIWAFIGPMGLLILVNSILLAICLRKASQIKTGIGTVYQFQRASMSPTPCLSLVKGSISLMVLLGIGWMSGFLMLLAPSPELTLVCAFIFTVLNASQGFLLFLLHFVMNPKVRRSLKHIFDSWLLNLNLKKPAPSNCRINSFSDDSCTSIKIN